MIKDKLRQNNHNEEVITAGEKTLFFDTIKLAMNNNINRTITTIIEIFLIDNFRTHRLIN